jgi:hypothetical protein
VKQSFETPFVSVVIASYGRAAMVVCAVRSVLAQTHSDLEVIVSDDASPDDTLEMLAGISDPRLRVRAQSANVGVWENWATALGMARGEYVVFLGDDDALSPNFVACHLEAFAAYPGVDVVFGPMEDLTLDGTIVSRTTPAFAGFKAGPTEIVRDFLKGRHLFWGSAMIRRDFAVKVWAETKPEGMVADWGFILRGCMFHGLQATSCTGCLYHKTVHPVRLSNRLVEVTTLLAELCERMVRISGHRHGVLVRALRREAAELRITLGRHHACFGEMGACRRQFRYSLSLCPWRPFAWSQLAQAYLWPKRVIRTSRKQRGLEPS